MPHFGLIDEKLQEKEKYLLRARLHVRGGKIRLNRGEISAGIAALYDAFIHALYWFFLSKDHLKSSLYENHGIFREEKELYDFLVNRGDLDGKFKIQKFLKVSEDALNSDLKKFQDYELLNEFDSLMEQLEVLPYDENLLPQIDSITL
ncbi:MAG: hypothetical protein ACXAEX_18395 [Promethearchaeota archaeon]|jgi:hypothetical protein